MIVNAVFIVGSCGNAESVPAVGLIPEVDPIPERHIRLDSVGRASVLFFQRFELSGTFCFCFRRYAFCNRQAFLIVPDNNSSFPPTVFTQAYKGYPRYSNSSLLALVFPLPTHQHLLVHKNA